MFVAKIMSLQSSLSSHRSRAALVRYTLATAAVLVALTLAYFLNSPAGSPLPYILLFPAIAFAAWWCGVGPSAISAGIALIGLRYWFESPSHSFRVPNSTESVGLLASCGRAQVSLHLAKSAAGKMKGCGEHKGSSMTGSANAQRNSMRPTTVCGISRHDCCNCRTMKDGVWLANCTTALASC
jgi:K+-sensing histidine kinase KdpD